MCENGLKLNAGRDSRFLKAVLQFCTTRGWRYLDKEINMINYVNFNYKSIIISSIY